MSEPIKTCDTCAKRGPWEVKQLRRTTMTLAECGHRPLPAFWGEGRPLLVAPGCGAWCKVWAPAAAEIGKARTQ